MSNDTNTRHRGIGRVESWLRKGHEAMKNRDAGRSGGSDLIQHSLAGMEEIRQAETSSIDFGQRALKCFYS